MAQKKWNDSLPLGGARCPFELEVFMRGTQQFTLFNIYGRTDNISDSGFILVGTYGSNLTYIEIAETLDIVSSSANDTVAGTGAQVIFVTGILQDGSQLTEGVTMNGTSTVTTTAEFKRVNRLEVLTAGSTGSNVGTITASYTTAGHFASEIEPAVGRAHQANFTVPKGQVCWLRNLIATVSDGGSSVAADIALYRKHTGEAWRQMGYFVTVGMLNAGELNIVGSEYDDIELRFRKRGGPADTDGQAYLQVVLGEAIND